MSGIRPPAVKEDLSANLIKDEDVADSLLTSVPIEVSSSLNRLPDIESGPSGSRKPNPALAASNSKQKRTSLACIRCRARHIRCPGGDPCKKCQLAKTKCEYVEADKKIVVSMKYLSKLHDDIARLKKDNAILRNNLKEEEKRSTNPVAAASATQPAGAPHSTSTQQPPLLQQNNFVNNIKYSLPNSSQVGSQSSASINSTNFNGTEVIQPSLDKHGRLIQSRTGEKVYVGSSSMTLFGLEIQNMVPSFVSSSLFPESTDTSPSPSPSSLVGTPKSYHSEGHARSSRRNKRETEILEKEGNAYKITLAKTNTRPGLSINFTLPSYSYAMLLVDTFINYNDGCFYFFNEGLVKKFLMNLYSGKAAENKKILRRNISEAKGGPDEDENAIKKDTDDDTILETIWFCKILLIFAIGEMYLGTESNSHIIKSKEMGEFAKRVKSKAKERKEKDTLPGSGFFYEASELFTGLFASGAIDNITKDGGIEVMLLYAFYLQVADCTIASYFYFGLALRSTLILGWHVDADKENLNRFELEHRRRIWWTVYMYERMLSSKAGLPLSFADDSVSTELPVDFNIDPSDFRKDGDDVRGYYIFPPADYINNCVTITQINAIILSSLYTKQPTVNILPVVSDLVHKLMTWKNSLPDFLRIDFSVENLRISRLIVNLMTEYFQGMNLAVRPLLFHFATKKLKELQTKNTVNKYVDLSKYSKNVLFLLNASFQASINTIKSIWALLPENMVALFGWMDREYLFTSASTLILFNASFGVHEATKDHLDHALVIFTKMKKLGNYPAALRRAQLLKLIKVLDFNGVMNDLLVKHDDDSKDLNISSENLSKESIDNHIVEVNQISNSKINNDHLHQLDTELSESIHVPPLVVKPVAEVAMAPLPDRIHQIHSISYPNANMHESFNFAVPTPSSLNNTGDVYTNSDLAGIEGLTYLDEEQKLWNEITNDAVWLNVSGGNPNQPPSSNINSGEFFNRQQNSVPGSESQTPHPDHISQYGPYTENHGDIYAHPNYANTMSTGGYSDIINSEFQDIMDQS
ncbi:fungal-specific transcription factor domain-containing protein [Scheffersomyces xylosifermentans]|uniref:fungal-specific transcription factor domain-containing protein n=1 Tax=Scheffersomyces xylosifermentans TaxID=1304137 RepID=UPI00315C69DA